MNYTASIPFILLKLLKEIDDRIGRCYNMSGIITNILQIVTGEANDWIKGTTSP